MKWTVVLLALASFAFADRGVTVLPVKDLRC